MILYPVLLLHRPLIPCNKIVLLLECEEHGIIIYPVHLDELLISRIRLKILKCHFKVLTLELPHCLIINVCSIAVKIRNSL